MAAISRNKHGARRAGFIRLRPRIVLSLCVVLALAFFGHTLWRRYEPSVKQHSQYQVTLERIKITPSPDWIQSDIRASVLRDAGLPGTLTILDDGEILEQLKQAFEFHPWVASVESVRKQLPAGIEIELTYRRPIAAVETTGNQELAYLPVDSMGLRLPEADLPLERRLWLPRITGVMGRPMIGQRWNDPRVNSAVRLAAALEEAWQTFRLMEIVPLPLPNEQQVRAGYSFEILTKGGTRIVWGAAPGEEPDDESPFEQKFQQLKQYVAENDNLHTIDGPSVMDLRNGLQIKERTAQEKRALLAELEKRKEGKINR